MAGTKDRAAVLTEISLLLAAVFWGLNFAATKFAALSIPPLLLVAFRFCIGGILMYGVLRVLEPQSRLWREDVLPMAALGCLGVVTTQTGFTFGLSLTSAASTGLIFSTATVWGMLIGSALGQERPTRRGVAGVVLSIVGWWRSSPRGWRAGVPASPATCAYSLRRWAWGPTPCSRCPYSNVTRPWRSRRTRFSLGARSCCSCPPRSS